MQVGGIYMIIGICGKSGSGKSTLAKQIIALSNHQAVHLEIDKVGHHVLLLPEVKEELIRAFGEEVVSGDKVDRKKLGNIVFDSRDEMNELTRITWKYMKMEIDAFLKENQDKMVILDWILLPESHYFDMCDVTILLDIPYEVRLQRAMKRDGITEDAFALREKASISYDKSRFDYVLEKNEQFDYKRMVKVS